MEIICAHPCNPWLILFLRRSRGWTIRRAVVHHVAPGAVRLAFPDREEPAAADDFLAVGAGAAALVAAVVVAERAVVGDVGERRRPRERDAGLVGAGHTFAHGIGS